MGFGEDDYGLKERRRSWRNILLPVMGFLLAGASAVIALVASIPVTDLLRSNLRGVPEGEELQIVVGIGIFLVLLLVFAMLYAMLAPKPTKMISEQQLDKEKKARQRELLEQKKRRRKINQEMARQNREDN